MAAAGADEEEARSVAESLVGANLRGHDSHGVMRLPSYVERIRSGALKPGSRLRIEKEAATTLIASGGWGFGQVVAREMMLLLIDKSAAGGVAAGALREAAHIGRLGEYAEMATERNMLAVICANAHGAAQRVAPPGGKRPRLGTNPICIGIPGGANGPFIMDFSTSATAEGKVRVKRIAGQPVPPGQILDPEGRPTTDPNQLYGDPPGTILPLGGDQAYKGFGLAFMIEMLAGALSGADCAHPNPPPPTGNAALFIVLNPNHFAGYASMANEILNLERYVRGVPLVEGVTEITLPGDPERRTLAERRLHGIPIDDGNWNSLAALAKDLAVTLPTG